MAHGLFGLGFWVRIQSQNPSTTTFRFHFGNVWMMRHCFWCLKFLEVLPILWKEAGMQPQLPEFDLSWIRLAVYQSTLIFCNQSTECIMCSTGHWWVGRCIGAALASNFTKYDISSSSQCRKGRWSTNARSRQHVGRLSSSSRGCHSPYSWDIKSYQQQTCWGADRLCSCVRWPVSTTRYQSNFYYIVVVSNSRAFNCRKCKPFEYKQWSCIRSEACSFDGHSYCCKASFRSTWSSQHMQKIWNVRMCRPWDHDLDQYFAGCQMALAYLQI